MAEAIGLVSSLVGIAATGAQIVTKLRLFASSYMGADEKVNNLSADVALTASILNELAKTIKDLEVDVKLKVEIFESAKAACERNFGRLLNALRDAKKDEKGKEKAGREIRKLTPWEKLKVGSSVLCAPKKTDCIC
jgi:hypothetical protein